MKAFCISLVMLLISGMLSGSGGEAASPVSKITALFRAASALWTIGTSTETEPETVVEPTQEEAPTEKEEPVTDPVTEPAAKPTDPPATAAPVKPTAPPTAVPTAAPTIPPTAAPTAPPTTAPTAPPTAPPTAAPTPPPTEAPSKQYSYPPTIDSLYSDIVFSKYGSSEIVYKSSSGKERIQQCLDGYAVKLESYGYKLDKKEDYVDSAGFDHLAYYFLCTTDQLTNVQYYGQAHQLVIIASYLTWGSDKEYGIFVLYSPDIMDHYLPEGSSSGGSSSGSSGGSSGGIDWSEEDKSCSFCGGDGKNRCTSCNGKGYYDITTSTPNYGGFGTGGTSTTRKRCSACGGDGKKDCNYCGGDGKRP